MSNHCPGSGTDVWSILQNVIVNMDWLINKLRHHRPVKKSHDIYGTDLGLAATNKL